MERGAGCETAVVEARVVAAEHVALLWGQDCSKCWQRLPWLLLQLTRLPLLRGWLTAVLQ